MTTQVTPTLLDADGTASMATALMMSHHGLRRDLARLALALRRPPGELTLLRDEWQRYRATLHGHHTAEDQGVFPGLRAEHPELAEVFDGLTADHRRIDPILDTGDRLFAALPATTADAAALIAQLSALLDAHLAIEEERIIPFLRDARSFPPPADDAAATMYAEGFAWASAGIATEVVSTRCCPGRCANACRPRAPPSPTATAPPGAPNRAAPRERRFPTRSPSTTSFSKAPQRPGDASDVWS
jgi:hypothetical protein